MRLIAILLIMFLAPVPAAQAKPHVAERCAIAFKHDRLRLHRLIEAELPYYESHQLSEQAMLDQLIELQAQPGGAEAIPQLQQGAGEFRATMAPLVQEEKEKAYAEVKQLRKTYRKCFSKKGRKELNGAADLLRSGFRDLFQAHSELFEANMSIEAADAGQAQRNMQEADVEYLPVDSTLDRGMKALLKLQ